MAFIRDRWFTLLGIVAIALIGFVGYVYHDPISAGIGIFVVTVHLIGLEIVVYSR